MSYGQDNQKCMSKFIKKLYIIIYTMQYSIWGFKNLTPIDFEARQGIFYKTLKNGRKRRPPCVYLSPKEEEEFCKFFKKHG